MTSSPLAAEDARRVLVTGGARSGKSLAAERLVGATDTAGRVTYVATSNVTGDVEWDARIAAHRARRPPTWDTVELAAPADLVTLLRTAGAEQTLLVDCVTLWLTSVVDAREAWDAADDDARRRGVDADLDDLLGAWSSASARVVLVTNEVGAGIVPATPSGRYFRDLLGALNHRLAASADEVRLVVVGRTLLLT